jgi:hypothetical protein
MPPIPGNPAIPGIPSGKEKEKLANMEYVERLK